MDELLKELEKVRKAMKSFVNREDLTDDEAEKLDSLNKQAAKLEARITAEKQLAQADVEAQERIEEEKRQAVAEAVKMEQAKARRLQFGESPYQTKYDELSRYGDLSAGATAMVIDVLKRNNQPVSGAAYKALAVKIGELKNYSNTEEEERGIKYVKGNFEIGTGIKADLGSIEASLKSDAFKAATDPMYTGGSGVGSDWVGTAYSSELWRTIRASNVIINRIPSDVIPDGYSSKYFPLESTDPTWYKVAEATASDGTLKVPAATVTASQVATGNKQITVGKLGARVLYTGEMTEDSLIASASQIRDQMAVSGAEVMEHVAIDGDVETSANKNINDIAGTPAGTEPFLLMDGFRKLALVTNTANSRSASGLFTIEDFKNTLKLMGSAGLAGADPTKLAFLLDYNAMWAAMDIPELKTKDVSSYATIENGFLARVYRTEVLNAYQMHRAVSHRKANTSGKIDLDTDGNNTTGAILAVRFDQWKQAFKRRMTLETTRIANADAWEIVALVRWGLAYRDNEASAITYNVGI